MASMRTGSGPGQAAPQLQKEMGSSDLTPPTARAVTDCAAAIGPDRRFYSTSDTVADLELLRQALGVRKMTLDGVSYGTYTAEQNALAYPQHVARLVLDSVVPQTGYDPMDRAAMRAAPRVLTAACEAIGCRTDPAADLAKVVDTYDNGVDVLDALTTWEFVDPDYAAMIDALHQAADGDPAALRGLIAGVRQGSMATAEELSQRLHASTLCLDGRYPWGRSDTPVVGRQEALEKAAADLTPAWLTARSRGWESGQRPGRGPGTHTHHRASDTESGTDNDEAPIGTSVLVARQAALAG